MISGYCYDDLPFSYKCDGGDEDVKRFIEDHPEILAKRTYGLSLVLDEPNRYIWEPDGIFENIWDPVWLDDPKVQRILLEIDNAVWERGSLIDKDEGYPFGVFDMSGGAKCLIYALKEDLHDLLPIRSSLFGDNCSSLLYEISRSRPITLYATHTLHFSLQEFEIYYKNKLLSYEEYLLTCIEGVKWYENKTNYK